MRKALAVVSGWVVLAGGVSACDVGHVANSFNDAVSGVAGPAETTDPDFATESEAAQPGELRGFDNPNGDPSYTLKSNGEVTPQEVVAHVTNKEDVTPPVASAAPIVQVAPGSAPKSDATASPVRTRPARPQRKLKGTLAKTAPAAAPASTTLTSGSQKALGHTPPPQGGGLDVD